MVRRPDPSRSAAQPWSHRTALRDGTPVLLRQIRPTDREQLADGFAHLSPSSRYLRFRAPIDRLTDEQLTELTEVDHHDHEAIVAIDLGREHRPGIGVARYVREPYEREVAETAVTVADGYQGRGVGTLLLGALAGRASDEGVRVFRSYVLAGNVGMLEVFDHLGARRERQRDGMWRVDLPLPDHDAEVADADPLRAFASLTPRPLTDVPGPDGRRRWWRRRRSDRHKRRPEIDEVNDLGSLSAEIEGDLWGQDPT